MAAPENVEQFLDLVRKSGVADEKRLDAFLSKNRAALPNEIPKVAALLVQNAVLTNFQAENIVQGKWKRFSIGKYKILERLGSGGFAQVYLCEHNLMRRRVAVKVLPVAKTKGSSALERFYLEARALVKLDHPNIVHIYDSDQDGDLHFLVLEYVDGASLQEIVQKTGPMSVLRACHYIAQAANALQHAHENGMVHRDVKPGNLLVDRSGVVKLLDLGLALKTDEDNQFTKIHDDGTLGTADYLSPEQAMDSHDVDIRTDIYSLGVTFYFLLTGRPPFEGLPIADKLLAHQMKQPPPVSLYRGDVSPSLLAIINKMMAKKVENRFTTPGEVAEALAPFVQEPIPPPSSVEMPTLSPAVLATSSTPAPPAIAPLPGAVQGVTTPVGPPAAPAPVAVPVAGEQAPWQQPMDDAPSPIAAEFTPDTPAQKIKAAPGISKLFVIILLMGFVVIPVFVAIGIGVVLWLFVKPDDTKPQGNTPLRLEVSKERKNAYRSIQAAIRNAEIDTVIELWDEVYEENVLFDGAKERRTNFTIQAAPGKEIVWRSARNDPDTPILRLIKTQDFKFKGKGIFLDGALGKDRTVNDLLMITSDCSGLVIEDLQFRNFARNAILVMNAAGSSNRPIRLQGLWTFTQPFEKPQGAIYFDANPKVIPAKNNHIEIRNCEFRGIEPDVAVQFNQKAEVLGNNVTWPGRGEK